MTDATRPPTLLGLPAYVLHRVAQRGERAMAAVVAGHDLALPHFAVLSALADFGPLSGRDLARRLHIQPSHLVRYLDELERRDAVRRERDPDDRRRQLVALTPAGERLIEELVPVVRRAGDDLFPGLTADERRTLDALLLRVLDAQDRGP